MLNKQELKFLKYPLYVCAPMVDQSQLPFRLLTRKYGCNLAYTPMLHSKMITTQKNYKSQHFTTCQQDRPLVAQLCGDDPQTMVKAAKMLEDQVDAIDINLGCPQGIARKGHYGSFLLDEPQLIYKIVKALTQNIKVPIFCKIRIRNTQEKTFEVVNKIVQAGCSLLTVHGRTKEQNKERVGECNWKIIEKIKQHVNIPVVANGGIHTFQDVKKCLTQASVDGVMSSEALLENPALFSGEKLDLDMLALQYIDLAQKYKGASNSCVRAHLFKMLFKGVQIHTDLRDKLVKANGVEQFREIATELKQRRSNMSIEDKFGWYERYQKKVTQKKQPEQEQKQQMIEIKSNEAKLQQKIMEMKQ